MASRFRRCIGGLLVGAALAGGGCGREPGSAASVPARAGAFEGSWNAAGTRRSIALGDGRTGSIIDLQGTMLLEGAGRPGLGFRAEVIALVDSATGLVGRGVWTDERGDRVFSTLEGEGTAESNRITGTILGGTGRYAGAEGAYEFSWRYVIEAEDGAIQGRTTGLRGSYRLGGAPAGDAGQ